MSFASNLRASVCPWRTRRCTASSCATRSRGKKAGHAVEQDRPDVLKQRRAWFAGQLDLAPERLVFIDETWTATDMVRSHGRA
jgi:hypothetical protein